VAASAPSVGSSPAVTASPAMTMENSPLATSTAPARQRPRARTPARRAAHQPVATLVAAVTSARAPAARATGGMEPGSVCRPKKTKNTAANRSRRGASNGWAASAACPESAMPTRNAPTAAETLSCWAIPATTRATPRITSSRASSLGLNTSRLRVSP
jgi:hypothetical protein